MALFLGVGIWLVASKGIFWFLATVLLLFLAAIAKIGCAPHNE